MSLLSFDVGRKRIGLAGCDPLGITVTILPAIIRSSFNIDLQKIQLLCLKREVKGLVIGVPLDDKEVITSQAIHCIKYGKKLSTNLALPAYFVNEHSSTWAAKEKFNIKNDRTGKIDSASAALILEQWLRDKIEIKINSN